MDLPETPLDLAQRHIAEGEERVAHQTALIDRLVQQGHDTTAAELLLSTMKETLFLMRSHLATELEHAANNRQ